MHNDKNILLADIGGTNSRFAILGSDGRPDRFVELRNDDFGSMEEAFARYLDQTGLKPRAAVCGFAGPIMGDRVRLTNRGWDFAMRDLERQFGFARVVALNDFEAAAWCLLSLSPDDIHRIGPSSANASGGGARVILGPGTGLGAAALIEREGDHSVVSGEGGNVSFGPAHDDEEAIFARLRQSLGFVSAERVISGRGLERLYVAINVGAEPLPAREIVPLAKRGDSGAQSAVAMFLRLLGRYAGDLALLFKATGGVYLTGGVARRLAPLLDAASFRTAFETHPPYEDWLRDISTTLITYDQPGLLGCAVIAARTVVPSVAR